MSRSPRAQRRGRSGGVVVRSLVRRVISSWVEACGSLLCTPAAAFASLDSLGARPGNCHKTARGPQEFASPQPALACSRHRGPRQIASSQQSGGVGALPMVRRPITSASEGESLGGPGSANKLARRRTKIGARGGSGEHSQHRARSRVAGGQTRGVSAARSRRPRAPECGPRHGRRGPCRP